MEEENGYREEQQVVSGYMEEVSPASCCLKGHRSTLLVETAAGGSICLFCFAALASDPQSPTHHVSYALSQINFALEDPALVLELRERHAYLLVPPLVSIISIFEDDALARQVTELISDLCFRRNSGRLGMGVNGEQSVGTSLSGDFIFRIADQLSTRALCWSRRQICMLHCFGELLNSHRGSSPADYIKEHATLFSNLLVGLQFPSEELRGEILFVIYKLCSLNITPWDDDVEDEGDCAESLDAYAAVLFRLVLEILLKAQHDEVRLNCLALLLVLVGKSFFQNFNVNSFHGIEFKEAGVNRGEIMQRRPLITLFADAVKGSLLSSDEQIQINTLDLIFHIISPENCSIKQLQVLVKENIPDYIFEILRLSGNKDPVVISCLQVLALFANAEDVFKQKVVSGFSTLLSVLGYISQIPMHPVQPQALMLVCNCISNFPGIMSISQVEELAMTLTFILRRCINGELPETFTLACLTFVEILKLPSAYGIQKIGGMVKESSTCAVLYSLSFSQENSTALIMLSLSLLKEAHAHSLREDCNLKSDKELEVNIIETCLNYLLPWLQRVINEEVEEDVVQEVLQTFHMILLNGSEVQTHIFANKLISSYWLTLCFTFMGLFPTDQMRSSVYLILSSLIDRALGPNFGQPIRDALLYLPLDPLDLIFLLGQESSIDPHLALCQRAVLLLLYVSSLSDERLADDTHVLASLEQYILINSNNFICTNEDSLMLTQVLHLYGRFRGSPTGEKISYSLEAEKTLLNLLSSCDLELFSFEIHPIALKWFFQQEDLLPALSNQILKFCRLSGKRESDLITYSCARQTINMQFISEFVVSGDNYVAPLLVSLLVELQQDGDNDLICVLNTMTGILKKFNVASIQFCLHNFAGAISNILYSPYCSSKLFTVCTLLVFNILYAANENMISQEEVWLSVTIKLLESINPKVTSQHWDEDVLLVLGIFCLILHHSRNEVLEEASKAILLNTHLSSAVENIVQKACAKGLSLVDHGEETETGRNLIVALLLNSFTLNCLSTSSIQDCLDWQDLLRSSKSSPPQLSIISIKCHDLCRLMHFGPSQIKSLSSQNLVEILHRISQQRKKHNEQLACPMNYLQSLIAIMEGLVFYEDKTVATNCSICLSMIISCKKSSGSELQEEIAIKNSKWLRTIMEEFTMTLTAPGLASKCFKNQHRPGSHIAIALLNLDPAPEWMASVFDVSLISGIINNLSAQNLSAEMVSLFRALLSRNYLIEDHIQRLNQVYQVCRKQVYKKSYKDKAHENLLENKLILDSTDFGQMSSLLIRLLLYPAYREEETRHERLLMEIDMFFQGLSSRGDANLDA